MKRWMLGGLWAVLSAGILMGCSGTREYIEAAATEEETTAASPKETKEIVIVQETETQPEEEEEEGFKGILDLSDREPKDGLVRSYLTGEWVDAGCGNRRPVAVMMSNDKAALPQYGINRAGVVYEAPVEGGMNRYMALIEEYDDLERIGSVRSCRTYYTYFAREFEAIYAHYGQSTFARPYLKNVDNINGLEGIGNVAYYRSSDRKAPHNAYTSGERLKKAIEQLGYSNAYPEDYAGHYQFADGAYSLEGQEGAFPAVQIVPGYVMNTPLFVYTPEDRLYHRYQYGEIHYGNEGPITVKNLLIQYCQMGYYANTEYRNINVHTSGENGYFFTDGYGIPITWDKDGEFGVTRYYGPDGKEIVLNQGTTWVCIVNALDEDKLEIYEE